MEEVFVDEHGRKYILGPEEDFNNTNPEHRDPEKFKFINGDVWVHTMMVLDKTREQTDNLNSLWGALLHDVGKPDTAGRSALGDINNHGHDKVGSEIALEVMTRLKASTKERETVSAIVGDHMKAHDANKMRKSRLRRFVAQAHLDELLPVVKADSLSSIPRDANDAGHKGDTTIFLKEVVANLDEEEGGVELPAPLVTGNDLISMGLKPGPLFKELLEEVANKQLDGEVSNREEALVFVKTLV